MAELCWMSSNSARQAKLCALQEAVRSKQKMCDTLEEHLKPWDFVYQLPDPNFDTRKVKGTILDLIDWCDPRYYTAVEIAADERLFSVVVDTDDTCMRLMKSGTLDDRTIFILLDQVNRKVINRNTVELAQQIGGGPENVKLVLDLISFDEIFRSAMNWVFGSTLVCKDFDTAQKMASHPAVKCCGVTVDGDVVEPCGAMTGGPKFEVPSILALKQQHKKMMKDLKVAEAELSQYIAELQKAEENTEM